MRRSMISDAWLAAASPLGTAALVFATCISVAAGGAACGLIAVVQLLAIGAWLVETSTTVRTYVERERERRRGERAVRARRRHVIDAAWRLGIVADSLATYDKRARRFVP